MVLALEGCRVVGCSQESDHNTDESKLGEGRRVHFIRTPSNTAGCLRFWTWFGWVLLCNPVFRGKVTTGVEGKSFSIEIN